jgi:hypothetical protein
MRGTSLRSKTRQIQFDKNPTWGLYRDRSNIKPKMETFMRANQFILVLAALLIGIGAKQYFFPPTAAVADTHAVPSAGMHIFQMHTDHPSGTLPTQKMHDMTFVFDHE